MGICIQQYVATLPTGLQPPQLIYPVHTCCVLHLPNSPFVTYTQTSFIKKFFNFSMPSPK